MAKALACALLLLAGCQNPAPAPTGVDVQQALAVQAEHDRELALESRLVQIEGEVNQLKKEQLAQARYLTAIGNLQQADHKLADSEHPQ